MKHNKAKHNKLRYVCTIVELSISPFSSVNFCFIYFAVLLLDVYTFISLTFSGYCHLKCDPHTSHSSLTEELGEMPILKHHPDLLSQSLGEGPAICAYPAHAPGDSQLATIWEAPLWESSHLGLLSLYPFYPYLLTNSENCSQPTCGTICSSLLVDRKSVV